MTLLPLLLGAVQLHEVDGYRGGRRTLACRYDVQTDRQTDTNEGV